MGLRGKVCFGHSDTYVSIMKHKRYGGGSSRLPALPGPEDSNLAHRHRPCDGGPSPVRPTGTTTDTGPVSVLPGPPQTQALCPSYQDHNRHRPCVRPIGPTTDTSPVSDLPGPPQTQALCPTYHDHHRHRPCVKPTTTTTDTGPVSVLPGPPQTQALLRWAISCPTYRDHHIHMHCDGGPSPAT